MEQMQLEVRSAKSKAALLLMPVFVLLFTRAGIEIIVKLLPLRYSWIPSVFLYYVSIELCLWYARRKLSITVDYGSLLRRPFPKLRFLVPGIVLPALIPLWLFVLNVKAVPPVFLIYIVLWAFVNPFFEEAFWRGLLDKIPSSGSFRILFSSFLFCLSHYFLWGSHWLLPPPKWIAAVVSTFIMGILWMWFYQRQKNLAYPIISHMLVDIFNLSVAVFYGLKLITV